MKIAALYDIHGNLPALEAALEDVRETGAEMVVFGGDVVPGPMPVECIERVGDLDVEARHISGNGDRETVALRRGIDTGTVPPSFRDVMRWVADVLSDEHEAVLANWPETLSWDIEGIGKVLFCHATPYNDMDIFTERTPEEVLLPVFESVDADLVVCGHTHMQFDRVIGDTRVVNAGSVGMPFGEPGAHWLLLGPDVELRHTRYDLVAAAERVRATPYPQAEEFAAGNIIEPPSAAQMLEAFTAAGLS